MRGVSHIDHRGGGQRHRPHPDAALAALAAAQHGVVSRGQLLDGHLTRREVERRVESGHLQIVHRGVYGVGHRRLTLSGRRLAAVLSAGPGAVLSHGAAGAEWNLRADRRAIVDVTSARRVRTRDGVRSHHAQLVARDRARIAGLPVTSVPRTLLDLAPELTSRALMQVLEAADRLDLLDVVSIDELFSRTNGHRGIGVLRRALEAYDPRRRHTRSEFEARMLEVLDTHGLPRPDFDVRVAGFEVDVLWRHARLVVELDSWEWHRTRGAFERDRTRDLRLAAAGLTCVRITWRALTDDLAATVASLRARLG